MKHFLVVAFSLCCLLTLSCDKQRIIDENKSLDDNSWDIKTKLDFKVNITDVSASYNMYINIRNAGWYPFSNIFLFINTTLPDSSLARDTAECTLADKDGRWLGDGLGDIWDNRILFKKNFKFKMTGEYHFELEQGMRVNPLPGIADVGIRIEKVAN